jgi:hypothetical protein
MHINKVTDGRSARFFLRTTSRNGQRFYKTTYANLSKWLPDELAELEQLLREQRRARGSAAKAAARQKVIEMVTSRTPMNKWWRLFSQAAPPLRPPISKHNPLRGENDA